MACEFWLIQTFFGPFLPTGGSIWLIKAEMALPAASVLHMILFSKTCWDQSLILYPEIYSLLSHFYQWSSVDKMNFQQETSGWYMIYREVICEQKQKCGLFLRKCVAVLKVLWKWICKILKSNAKWRNASETPYCILIVSELQCYLMQFITSMREKSMHVLKHANVCEFLY